MTVAAIRKQETALALALNKLQAQFPNFTLSYELDTAVTDTVSVVKEAINQVKSKFPNYKFSICRNSYDSLLIVNIKSVDKNQEFAYYGGDSCGYIVCNNDYSLITTEFKNNQELNFYKVRTFDYIENAKTMQLEFKQY